MKVRFNRWYNAVLTALLSMLGIESCNVIGNEPLVEYGCPYVKYQIEGLVSDEAGSPVQGVKVSVREGLDNPYSYTKDSVLTDVDGRFQLKEMETISLGYGEALIVEDIDGEAHGLFKNDTISIDKLPKTQIERGSGWYDGKYELKAEIKLKKKE